MDYKPLSNLFIELWVANSLLNIPLCLNEEINFIIAKDFYFNEPYNTFCMLLWVYQPQINLVLLSSM